MLRLKTEASVFAISDPPFSDLRPIEIVAGVELNPWLGCVEFEIPS